MAIVKRNIANNYNEAIAKESNNIGQKLFAYIANGKNINDRIRDKFKKSLIFIGDEGQIYNPLTNTYVGIGQTAYTATISYIEDAHEKINALQKMLASSMVSAIYANWSKEDWDTLLNDTESERGNFVNYENLTSLSGKVFATNEIVIKGHGDYDTTTKLAATREYVNIEDNDNATEAEQSLFKHSYKKLNPETAFATSGITVSLEKGKNRYLYCYTFTNNRDAAGVGEAADVDVYAKVQNIYLTDEEYVEVKKIANASEANYSAIIDEVSFGKSVIDRDNLNENGEPTIVISSNNKEKVWKFWQGICKVDVSGYGPVYTDGFDPTGKTEELKKRNQLFKQASNILTIDDKQTWSYIASAYSYTLDFAKEYTDNQVNKIYRELLGEQDRLLPVNSEQVKVLTVNPDAVLDADKFTWNENTQSWTLGTNVDGNGNIVSADGINESSKDLSSFVLNYSSVFVERLSLKNTLTGDNRLKYNEPNFNVEDSASVMHTVLPWSTLIQLSKNITAAKQKVRTDYENTYTSSNALADYQKELNAALNNAVETAISSYILSSTEVEGVTVNSYLNATDVLSGAIAFMGYDRTAASEHTEDGSYDRELSFNESRGDTKYPADDTTNGGAHKSETSGKGSYGSSSDNNGDGKTGYGYNGTKYNLPYIYKLVSKEAVESGRELNNLFAVNTSAVDMDKINLADGIQTLKEVAYILDIITDGWGNQYDPEGNGILLTYTIANNHERIEDHEKRIRELEGGTNIVKAIYKDNRSMSKYVNLHFESDTSWFIINQTEVAEGQTPQYLFKTAADYESEVETHWGMNAVNNDGTLKTTFGLSYKNGEEWFAVYKNEFKAEGDVDVPDYVAYIVPRSYIISYNLKVGAYLTHSKLSDHRSDVNLVRPMFADFYEHAHDIFGAGTKFNTPIEPVSFVQPFYLVDEYNNSKISYIKDINGNTYDEHSGAYFRLPTYVGQVGIGIDLNVATTYTVSSFCDLTSGSGLEVVDINSEFVKKTAVLNIVLPKYIETAAGLISTSYAVFVNPEENDTRNTFNKPWVNSRYRFTDTDLEDIANLGTHDTTVVTPATLVASLSGSTLQYYASDIEEYLANFKGISSVTIVPSLSTTEQTSVRLSISLTINPIDAINTDVKTGYRPYLYESASRLAGNTDDDHSLSALKETNAHKIVDSDDNEVAFANLVISGADLLSSNLKAYFIRKDVVASSKQVFLSEDALTNVDWVTTYVSHVVDKVKQDIKGIEFEAYQYSRSLIESLDSTCQVSYGYFVAGIEQVNGIVKPIIRELPKDTISATTKVWGETSDGDHKGYVVVNSNDITDEIAMDTPLFVIKGTELVEIKKNVNVELVEVGSPNPESAKFIAIKIDDTTNEFVYNSDHQMIAANEQNANNVFASIVGGTEYRNFVQYYTEEARYVRIDGADIRIDGSALKLITNGVASEVTVYKLNKAEGASPAAQKKYITAESVYQADNTDGVGGNSMKVTAHLTKISDATETNSGLVDAYDVRNTFDNLFEWVDLSRWDLDTDAPVNPVNTASNEAGAVEASIRIRETKAAGNQQLGYPKTVNNASNGIKVAADGTITLGSCYDNNIELTLETINVYSDETCTTQLTVTDGKINVTGLTKVYVKLIGANATTVFEVTIG